MSAGFHTSGSIALTTLSIQSKHTGFFSSRQKSYLSTVNCFLGQSGSSLFLYSPETVIRVLNPQRPRQSLSCTRFVKSYVSIISCFFGLNSYHTETQYNALIWKNHVHARRSSGKVPCIFDFNQNRDVSTNFVDAQT